MAFLSDGGSIATLEHTSHKLRSSGRQEQRMGPPILCRYCQYLASSPRHLFEPTYDNRANRPINNSTAIIMPPFARLRCNAAKGCELCQIFIIGHVDDSITPHMVEQSAFSLRHSIIASERQLTAFIDIDDYFVKPFTRIEAPFGEFVYDFVRLGSLIDEFCRFGAEQLAPASLTQKPSEVEYIRLWLSECLNSHERCKQTQPVTGPARLLDLYDPEKSSDICLVDCPRRQVLCSVPFVAF